MSYCQYENGGKFQKPKFGSFFKFPIAQYFWRATSLASLCTLLSSDPTSVGRLRESARAPRTAAPHRGAAAARAAMPPAPADAAKPASCAPTTAPALASVSVPGPGLDLDPGVERETEPASRLAIESLRLENFKSYGGVVTVGPFHKSFSAVVGPNGSGKSNVIDAMLFVFGRRAKQLRHSKVRELLHHSDTFPDVQSATVTVNFHDIVDTGDGDDDFEVVPGSPFSVARRAFRNDTSKYYVNGKEVKAAAVVSLLKAKGIDLDNNRFLILQGEVEQIAMMKPKAATAHDVGLLEYLEDIIGSNRHVEAITESGKIVEELNEERSHKLTRVKMAERERDSLEDAKREAEDFMDKERALLTKRLRITQSTCHQTADALRNHEKQAADAQTALETSRELLKDAESRAEVLQAAFEEKKRVANAVCDELNAAKDTYTAIERADIELGTDIKAVKVKERKAKTAVERVLKRTAKVADDFAAREAEIEKAEAEVADLNARWAQATAQKEHTHAEVHRETEPLRVAMEKKKEQLQPLKDAVLQCQRDMDVTSSERDLMQQSLNDPVTALQEASANLVALKGELEAARAEKDNVFKQKSISKAALANVNKDIQSAQTQLQRATGLVADLRRKVKGLQEAKQASESIVNSNRRITALYKASREGKLKGIIGRLGDLGSIGEEYGIAAGAAAGSSLDNIVVKTAEDAQASVAFLRKHNLGGATHIILDKISWLNKNMAATHFDGPRLFDLVRTENDRDRLAFYFVLRDTLVARNLDEARRMAYKPRKKNRVVTMAGELIDTSGAMTGGGRGPPRHRLASKQSAIASAVAPPKSGGNLEAVEAQLQAGMSDVQTASAEVERLQNEARRFSLELEQAETEHVKVSNNVDSLERQVSDMASNMLPALRKTAADARRVLEDNTHPRNKKLAALSSKIEEFERALIQAKDACVDLERDIEGIQNEIVAAGGKDLQDANEAVEACQRAISENQKILSCARSQASAIREAQASADKALAKAKAEVEQAAVDRSTILEKRAAMEVEAGKVHDTFKDLEARHDEASAERDSLAKDFAAVKAEKKKGQQAELPLVEAFEDSKHRVAKSRGDLWDLRKNIKKLKHKLAELAETVSEAALPDAVNSITAEAAQAQIDGDGDADEEGGDGMDLDGAAGGDGGDGGVNEDDEGEGEDIGEGVGADTGIDSDGSSAVLPDSERKDLEMAIVVLQGELANTKPNLGAIADYHRKNEEYTAQAKELDDLTARRDVARKENDRLRKARLDEFMQGFSVITLKLKELYQMITLGGDAELELVDSLDPFSEGIVFSVRPPKKSWKSIANLSGGEKTLSSLALVFALHHFKPTPLYFLDEIDAALDFKNVSIIANYIKERTKNAQFIIISLRNQMFELADRLVGIYKTYNTTKSVAVNPKAFVIPAQSRPEVAAAPLRELPSN